MGPDRHQVALGIARHHSGIALAKQTLEPLAAAAGRPIEQAAQPRATQQGPLDAAEGFASLLIRHRFDGLQEGLGWKGSWTRCCSLQFLAVRCQRLRWLARGGGALEGKEHHRRVGRSSSNSALVALSRSTLSPSL